MLHLIPLFPNFLSFRAFVASDKSESVRRQPMEERKKNRYYLRKRQNMSLDDTVSIDRVGLVTGSTRIFSSEPPFSLYKVSLQLGED